MPGCRLCVVDIGDTESVSSDPAAEPLIGDPVGPVFRGVPVLGSDTSTLAVVGTDPDGVRRVWRGQPETLEPVGEPPPFARMVALVHHGGRWHLFGTDDDRRARHATSADLVTWDDDQRFVAEHPHLAVCGAAATSTGVVLLGQVIVHRRRMGWTLLEDCEGSFAAREVAFPLTADHLVIGPVHLGADELALMVVSGSSNLVARSISGTRGRSWTLGLLSDEVAPMLAVGTHGWMWVAGTSPSGDAPVLAQLGGRVFHLGRDRGVVVAAVMHGEQLVLASTTVTVANSPTDPPTDGASADGSQHGREQAQSSPAYIDSISAA